MKLGEVQAQNVQYSWGEHGPASLTFDVPVQNAYLAPPTGLYEGAWLELWDGGHLLWDGEIISIKPSVSGGVHSLAVDAGGMLTVAGKRKDLVKTWTHRGGEGWARYPGTPEIGSFTTDNGGIVLSVPVGSTENFNPAAVTSNLAVIWALDSLCSDDEISYLTVAGTYNTATDSGHNWGAALYTASSLIAWNGWGTGWTNLVNWYAGSGSIAASYTPAAGTKVLGLQLYCDYTAYTTGAVKHVTLPTFDIYSSGRTTKARIDEAMIDIATRPGLAVSYSSKAVGNALDHLEVGSAASRTDPASALEETASRASQPFNWRFKTGRTFDVRPRLWTPDDDSRVIMCGPSFPGMTDWDVAEYDEENAEYACVIFGNLYDATRGSTAYPEAWPRRVYRPITPPDDNVRVETVDLSGSIMADKDAQAVGDYIVATKPAAIPPDYVFRWHPERARNATWPNDNDNLLTRGTTQEMSDSRATGTLSGMAYTSASGWGGTNSPADPTCIVLDGSDDYIDFGDLNQCDFGAGAMTVSTWVKPLATKAEAVIVSKMPNSAPFKGWSLQLDNLYPRFYYSQNSTTTIAHALASGVYAVGVWYHLVAVYPGSGQAPVLYTDGAVAALTSSATAAADASNANNLRIGNRDANTTTCGNNAVGETIIWPRALSATEVAQIYNAGPAIYDRSLSRGTVTIQGRVKTRKGTYVDAKHVRPIDYWVQNPSVGKGRPLLVTGTSVDPEAGVNALTIGTDWMYDEIGISQAELLAVPATAADEETVNPDPWKNWR